MKNSKFLAIMASHRKNKNTDFALNRYISDIGKNNVMEKIYLLDYKIERCISCGYCEKNYGSCSINDDMKILYNMLKTYNNIIFATPVYFNSVSTLAKIFIDRCQMIFQCSYTHKKPFVERVSPGKGIIISTAGSPPYKKQFLGVELTVEAFFRELNISIYDHIKISDTDHHKLYLTNN